MRGVLRILLQSFPRLKGMLRSLAGTVGIQGSVSAHYKAIKNDQVEDESRRLRASWQGEDLPRRQRVLVDSQLAEYRQGKALDVFDVFVDAVGTTGLAQGSLLEVGCSSGFYSEVMAIKGLALSYTGCDYSAAFIDLARERYPDVPFHVGDATQLDFADDAFDIVVSGCCLLHIPEYGKAIAETARVASKWAIFHRTPVVRGSADQYYRKQAYGVETIEIHFNEDQLMAKFVELGLEIVRTITLDESRDAGPEGIWRYNRTYVCRKISYD